MVEPAAGDARVAVGETLPTRTAGGSFFSESTGVFWLACKGDGASLAFSGGARFSGGA